MVRPVIPIRVNGRVEIIFVGAEPPKPALQANAEPTPQATTWNRSPPISLAQLLQAHDVTKSASIEPCGLINRNNLCYLNSVLQALLHCGPFLFLLQEIRSRTRLKIGSSAPVLDVFIAFAGQYETQAARGQVSSAEQFYSVISSHPNFRHLQKGRQEDAQEFMGYLLDTLEQTFDEALAAQSENAQGLEAEAEEDPSEDSWTQVGKHSKSIVERQSGNTLQPNNPIPLLFGGKLRNVLRVRDANPSITVDPFQQLLLDIESSEVQSIQDALNLMQAPESLSMEKNGRLVPATKQLEFVRLPPVLVMQLKRFTFIRRGAEFDFGKITKPVRVGNVTLKAAGVPQHYEPFAIVYHHGPSATAGHYTTEVKVKGKWVCIDDDFVTQQRHHNNSSAYIAFYQRVE